MSTPTTPLVRRTALPELSPDLILKETRGDYLVKEVMCCLRDWQSSYIFSASMLSS
jgi:hypothetical protein